MVRALSIPSTGQCFLRFSPIAMTEIEFKFGIPPQRHQAVEAAVRRGAVTRTHLQARYFDTADNALTSRGIALRVRKEERRWIQTVKAAGADAIQRLEHNVDLGVFPAGVAPEPDPNLHAGTPAGDALAQALADTEQPLALTYSTDIWRLTRLLRIPGGWVELALDSGHIAATDPGNPAATVKTEVLELELELIRGHIDELTALAQRWATRHGLWFSAVSKAERGERLRQGLTEVPPVKATSVRYRPAQMQSPHGAVVLQAALASCLAQILPNASEVGAGSDDAEQVHQLRIGIRRLRTALRELAPLAPTLIKPQWEAPLVAAFRALGELRDREEVLETAQAQLLAAGGPELDLPASGETRPASDIVRTPAFQTALLGLIGLTAQDPHLLRDIANQQQALAQAVEATTSDDEAEAQAIDALPAVMDADTTHRYLRLRLKRLHTASLRDGKQFMKLDMEDRHRTRKRLKRLRYLLEFVQPLFDKRASNAYLGQLRPAQDALGEYNDEVVALATYQSLSQTEPRAWFGAGWFAARQHSLASDCARQLQSLKTAPRFWDKT